MKRSSQVWIGAVVIIALLGLWVYISSPNDVTSITSYSDLIHVDAPLASATVTSPLTVTGEARGSWYFEASFPVKLVDADGTLLVQSHAQAQGEWMTSEFVPFKALLSFSQPATLTGTLIISNDNPSGLPENDKEVRIPVRFAQNHSVTKAAFGKGFMLRVGEEISFPDGLLVALKEINDSRCKPEVQCIWQGELAPVLMITGGELSQSSETIQLGTVTNQAITRDVYSFTLQSATETTASFIVNK